MSIPGRKRFNWIIKLPGRGFPEMCMLLFSEISPSRLADVAPKSTKTLINIHTSKVNYYSNLRFYSSLVCHFLTTASTAFFLRILTFECNSRSRFVDRLPIFCLLNCISWHNNTRSNDDARLVVAHHTTLMFQFRSSYKGTDHSTTANFTLLHFATSAAHKFM